MEVTALLDDRWGVNSDDKDLSSEDAILEIELLLVFQVGKSALSSMSNQVRLSW